MIWNRGGIWGAVILPPGCNLARLGVEFRVEQLSLQAELKPSPAKNCRLGEVYVMDVWGRMNRSRCSCSPLRNRQL